MAVTLVTADQSASASHTKHIGLLVADTTLVITIDIRLRLQEATEAPKTSQLQQKLRSLGPGGASSNLGLLSLGAKGSVSLAQQASQQLVIVA